MEYCHCGSIRVLLESGYVLNEEELREIVICVNGTVSVLKFLLLF